MVAGYCDWGVSPLRHQNKELGQIEPCLWAAYTTRKTFKSLAAESRVTYIEREMDTHFLLPSL